MAQALSNAVIRGRTWSAGLALAGAVGCSTDSGAGDLLVVDAGARAALALPATPLSASPEAQARVAALRDRFEVPDAPAVEWWSRGPRLEPRVTASARAEVAGAAQVAVSTMAQGTTAVLHAPSGRALSFRLLGAREAPAEVASGFALYRGASPFAGDVLLRVHAEGVEDFVEVPSAPSEEALRYAVDVSAFAGVRLVSDTLELLDAEGEPLLRVATPSLVDARGERHAAALGLEACAYDADPRAPWGRPVTPPGASSCTLVVRWDHAARCAGRRLCPDPEYPLLVDPAWTTTGSLSLPRTEAFVSEISVAGVLRILVAGGFTSGTSATNKTELFNGTSWTATGNLGTDRAAPAGANRALAGEVIVAGGYSYGSGAFLASAERYSAATGTWTANGSLQAARFRARGVTLASGDVLIIGGSTDGTTASTLVDKTVPPGGTTWQTWGTLPTGQIAPAVVRSAALNRVLVFATNGSGYAVLYNDPASGSTWNSATGASTLFTRGAVTALPDGRLFVTGGINGAVSRNTTQFYNPATDAWSPGPALIAGRYNHSATLIGSGRVLIAGGETSLSTTTASAEIYDPAQNRLFAAANLASKRTLHFGIWSTTSSRALIGGGSDSVALSSCQLFGDQVNGLGCVADGDCTSLHCVDGVCCNTACDLGCQSCLAAYTGGANGTCASVSSGADPDDDCPVDPVNTCARDGTCNGSGGCRQYVAGTTCLATTCAAATLTLRTCNGSGTCGASTASCGSYQCATGSTCATSCTGDAQCLASAHCSGNQCLADLAQGQPCSAGSWCTSGYCVDGVCCNGACDQTCEACSAAKKNQGNDGTCGPIAAGFDPDGNCNAAPVSSCGLDGSCNGSGACRYYQQGVSCGSTVCEGNLVKGLVCTGAGVCQNSATGTDCAPYLCASGACRNPCTGDADCVGGNFCDAGVCRPRADDGEPCTGSGGCISAHCVDGVCCDSACTGACQACTTAKTGLSKNGVCGVIAAGSDPDGECPDDGAASCDRDGTCNGLGACRVYAAGTSCAGATCVGNELRAQQCDGLGACAAAATGTACAPYQCAGGACTDPCASDAQCTSGNFCLSGVCTPKQPDGASCTGPNACQNAHCVDGVCCNSTCTGACSACSAAAKGQGNDGECGPVASGTDPDDDCAAAAASTCQNDGACDGTGACRKHQPGVSCGASVCAGNAVTGLVCDGFGSCANSPAGIDCGLFACRNGGCANPCGVDADCVAGTYCDAGVCTPKAGNGSACTGAGACASGFCVDGLCCDTLCDGLCRSCSAASKVSGADGTCGAARAGQDPHDDCPDDGAPSCDRDGTCDGAGACARYVEHTVCGVTACIGDATNGFQVNAYECDGQGACAAQSVADCGVAACTSGVCSTSCVDDTDCTGAGYCSAGSCVGKLTPGAACTSGSECASASCVDGVCCDRACAGQCEACDVATSPGTCTPVTGPPHGARAACAMATSGDACSAALCDGDVRTTCAGYVGPEVSCRSASCSDGVATLAASCNGRGVCPELVTSDCTGGFACEGDHCRTACAADLDCRDGFRCDVGASSCVPRDASVCEDDFTLVDPLGTRTSCKPYRCEGSACRDSCVTTSDCASGYLCAAGACAARQGADAGDEGGCGCRTAPRSHGGRGAWALAALLLGLAHRRARRAPRGTHEAR